jgi:D-threo-aldose 1-dehydrogenase
MKSARLNRGLSLTELGFGGAQIGNLYRATTDQEAAAAAAAAWDAGIRYFDTAPHYGLGLSEQRLGRALRDYPRDDIVVSTKVGRLLEPVGSASDPDPEGFAVLATHRRVRDYSRDGVLRSIEGSLERLGLDRIDLVLIHDPDDADHAREAVESAAPALSQLRSEGVIGGYGAGMNQSAMLTRFVQQTDVDVVMLAGRYTLLDQSAAIDLLPAALDRGVGVINAGIFNSGLLSRPQPRLEAHFDYGTAPSHVIQRTRHIADVCDRFGVDLPSAAVAFAGRHPAVASVVVGLRTPAQVDDLMARWRRVVPDALWTVLVEEGLLRPEGVA